jgi:uncharacterized protein (UPF0332 family)
MTRKIKTRQVDKGSFTNFLQKAEENLRSAEKGIKAEDWNASAVSSVHSAIWAGDAYCVYGLAKRSAGEKHEDCETLIMDTPFPKTTSKKIAKLFMSVIKIKNMAEYEERLVKKNEAEKAVQNASELLDMIKAELE